MIENNVYVRRAVAMDIEGIMNVTQEAFVCYAQMAELSTVEALNETTEQVMHDIENKLVYVAMLDGVVVGSVRIEINPRDNTAYLSRFGVAQGYQNLGIGKALIQSVDKDMESMGVKKLSLHTASKVNYLVIFYYSKGFYIESVSTDKGYLRALLVKNYALVNVV